MTEDKQADHDVTPEGQTELTKQSHDASPDRPGQQGQPLPGQPLPGQPGQPPSGQLLPGQPGQPGQPPSGQPLPGQPGQPPPGQKKSPKGCLIGCLVVFLVLAIGLSVAALLIARNTDNIFQWVINRITGEESTDNETTTIPARDDETAVTITEPPDETEDEPGDEPDQSSASETTHSANGPEEGEGEDIESIERFPGSILVEAWSMSFNDTNQDFVQYATTGDLVDVRQHFEGIVDRDWDEKNVMTLNNDVIITAQSVKDDYAATLQISITKSSQYEDYLEVAIFRIMEPDSE